MKNYLIRVSYDGSNYYGSQYQVDKPSIEGAIRDSLEKYFHMKIPLTISSRTDRGVHSLDHPMLIKLPIEIDILKTRRNLNWCLPSDIQINSIIEVDKKFHPRFNSKEKTYRYVISQEINVFNSRYVTYYRNEIDVEKLKEIKDLYIGRHDYFNFTSKNKKEDYVREVTSIDIIQENDQVIFYISGKGFLRFMIRNIISSFLEYNEDKLTKEKLLLVIDRKIDYTFSKSDPNGLTLFKVIF